MAELLRNVRLRATVEVPASSATGATVKLRQKAWSATVLRGLVRVLTRAAEKLDS